jgi:N-methylhydantoinase A
MLDIHTIGAGGGSIAHVDAGGALRVGPESAGADPGPACYGRGDLPTVTDANLVLGRLSAEHFLGGEMPLDKLRAQKVMSKLGGELNLTTEQAALGVVAVSNAHMERALRLISVERGHDPRFFMLLSFGGAGGLHAADLARGLGIPNVVVPPLASTLSAFGMLAADVVKDYTLTVMLPGPPLSPTFLPGWKLLVSVVIRKFWPRTFQLNSSTLSVSSTCAIAVNLMNSLFRSATLSTVIFIVSTDINMAMRMILHQSRW